MPGPEVQITPTSYFAHGQTTVGGVAVRVVAVGGRITRAILIKAKSSNTTAVFVGKSTVTTLTGFELLPGDSITFELNDREDPPYAVAAVGGQTVCWVTVT